jgi:hypothetical protein
LNSLGTGIPLHYQPAELAAAGGVMKKFKELSVAEVQGF